MLRKGSWEGHGFSRAVKSHARRGLQPLRDAVTLHRTNSQTSSPLLLFR